LNSWNKLLGFTSEGLEMDVGWPLVNGICVDVALGMIELDVVTVVGTMSIVVDVEVEVVKSTGVVGVGNVEFCGVTVTIGALTTGGV